MDTKNLSPAFFTSLAVIFLGALLIGLSSPIWVVLGWLIFLVGLGLNVFSTLVVLQKAKGGPLPELIERTDYSLHTDRSEAATTEEKHEGDVEKFEHHSYHAEYEPEQDTEAQNIVVPIQEDDGRIFRSKRPRVRNR